MAPVLINEFRVEFPRRKHQGRFWKKAVGEESWVIILVQIHMLDVNAQYLIPSSCVVLDSLCQLDDSLLEQLQISLIVIIEANGDLIMGIFDSEAYVFIVVDVDITSCQEV